MSPRSPVQTPSVSAYGRPPRLVLLFVVLTALGVAAAAAVILVVVRQADEAHAERTAADHAHFAATAVLAPNLRTSDLTTAIPAERRAHLDRLLRRRVLLGGIQSATLYGTEGRAVYATAGAKTSGRATAVRMNEALSGVTVSEAVHAADGSRILRTYVPVADPAGTVQGVVRLDQSHTPIAATARNSLLIAGVLEGLLVLLFIALVPVLGRASTRIGAQLEELAYVATHDELTGMPNRYAFRRMADTALRTVDSAALMLVDLDGFSRINSSLGSAAGDRLLIDAGIRLTRELSPDYAVIARLGEDEFGVVCEAADVESAEWVARRVRRALGAPLEINGVRMAVDVDVGVALYPGHGADLETLLGHAATALVAAKGEGTSGVQVYDPASHSAHDNHRLTIAADLRDALEMGQLSVHYQPQSDLLTHRIRGVEALVRWEHPQRGLLTAGEFITDVERSGLAQELRRFVVSTGARQWQEWHALGLDLELAVNLSAIDLLDPALPDEIEDATSRHGMPPWNLVLEITERTLVRDERRTRQVVDQLGRIGVRFSIDDFGTGYSSLASLRSFPIHQLKLDRSLLADVPGDEAAEAIVGGSVEIAHGLGALVVAEGIEDLAQLQFASAIGCDIAQGYLIGAPAPADELLDLLDTPRLVPLSIA
jgi:diguanylate cyclase (GGDEF)-like protein